MVAMGLDGGGGSLSVGQRVIFDGLAARATPATLPSDTTVIVSLQLLVGR